MSKLDKTWNDKLKILKGLKIKSAYYMSEKDAKEWMWYKRPVVINFEGGFQMILSADDEGNDGGSAFTNIKGLETIPTLY